MGTLQPFLKVAVRTRTAKRSTGFTASTSSRTSRCPANRRLWAASTVPMATLSSTWADMKRVWTRTEMTWRSAEKRKHVCLCVHMYFRLSVCLSVCIPARHGCFSENKNNAPFPMEGQWSKALRIISNFGNWGTLLSVGSNRFPTCLAGFDCEELLPSNSDPSH